MVKVTVSGGSNGLGKVIVRAIAATGKHEVSVLSRQGKETTTENPIPVLTADYTNPESIASVLRSNGTEVVISTIGVLFEDTHQSMMSLWSLGFAWGWYDLTSYKKSEKTLNEMFPELETITFKSFMARCFGEAK
ncbi:hypothetical protein CEP54_002961 [Fusarium duplospermum]|uniref:NmrA-like domain-containing protein n=1 Tax=Fusarium duplospermum TaxID=1325734 RepID=A0A428QRX2_9HYPO|nr:hypothetical protein CEP54_002961 [Fusarium duplospermum]